MTKQTVLTRLALVIAVVIALNLVVNKVFFRLDFTADQRYTLSDATENTLEGLEDVISIKAYFSKDLPPQFANIRQDFENLLSEYETLSGGNLVYEFINPNKDEESEIKAQQAGIAPLMVNITERDQSKQIRAYMGVVIEAGNQKEVIPFIQQTGTEFNLTKAIKKLTIADKPVIGFLQGHGEASQQSMVEVMQQLQAQYKIENITITDSSSIPGYCKSLLIVNPTDTFPDSHLKKLDDYLQQGGNVFLAHNRLDANLQQQFWQAKPEIGIEKWLDDKGVKLQPTFAIDVQCGQISVQQQQGPFVFNSAVNCPFIPLISNFGDHPASKGLEQIILPFSGVIDVEVDSTTVQYTAIAKTSEQSGTVTAPTYFDVKKEWQANDFNEPEQNLAVALEGGLVGEVPSKLVVVANGDFAINGEGQQQQRVNPDNINFFSNSVDWLSDDTGLIELRTKGVTARPIEKVEDSTRELLKYGNLLLPIVLILAYGFIRKQRNAKKRQAWIQGDIS